VKNLCEILYCGSILTFLGKFNFRLSEPNIYVTPTLYQVQIELHALVLQTPRREINRDLFRKYEFSLTHSRTYGKYYEMNSGGQLFYSILTCLVRLIGP
jgi:hypothetical protein